MAAASWLAVRLIIGANERNRNIGILEDLISYLDDLGEYLYFLCFK